LKAGVLYEINLEFRKQSGNGRVGLHWSSPSVPKEIIPAASFYLTKPLDLFTSFELLHKSSMLINTFRMSADELSYLIKNKEDFKIKINGSEFSEILDLNGLVKPSKDLKKLFEGWERLADIFYLRDKLSLRLTTLLELLDVARNSPQSKANDFMERLSNATGWNSDDLRFLAGYWDPSPSQLKFVVGYFSFNFPADFRNEKALLRLLVCFKLIRRLGLSASNINDWIIPVIDYQKALNFKRAEPKMTKSSGCQ
jgi:hypothetical protein